MGLLELVERKESYCNNVDWICSGTSLGYFLITPNQTIKTEEIASDSNDLTTKTTIVTTRPHDIPKA